jgi:hypothetical protein
MPDRLDTRFVRCTYGTTNNNGNLLSQTIARPGQSWTEALSFNFAETR